jgi:hypothetical protein
VNFVEAFPCTGRLEKLSAKNAPARVPEDLAQETGAPNCSVPNPAHPAMPTRPGSPHSRYLLVRDIGSVSELKSNLHPNEEIERVFCRGAEECLHAPGRSKN